MSARLRPVQLSIRAALAAGLAVALAELLQLRHPLYALVAAVIVTDLSPAATRRLGLQRLAGTVLGATTGGALSQLLPPGAWAIGLAILTAMLLGELLHLEGGARMTGYVCGIVVLEHGSHPWSYALDRTIETVLGIAVALAVSAVPKLVRVDEAEERAEESERTRTPSDDAP
jgi:uncharacterized membrane protein YgaE (UPF0421/DUF939 family)